MTGLKLFLKKYKEISIIFLVSFFLVVVWFQDQRLLATGEESLFFYEPQIAWEKFSAFWLDVGTGTPNAAFLPRLPLYYFMLLGNSIFPDWLVQALIYFLLMFSGGLWFYILSKELIRLKNMNVYLFAALFYILNLYSQTQVWNRFLVPSMFAWSYLPLFMFLWINWIRQDKLKYIGLFLLSSLIYSNTFTVATFVITLWVPAFVYLLVYVFTTVKDRKSVLLRGLAAVLTWGIINLWWIYPFIKIGGSVFSEIFTWESNFDSLRGVTNGIPLWNIFVLYHKGFMTYEPLWGRWYQGVLPMIIGVGIFCLVTLGGIKLYKGKQYFLLILSLIALFIIKGTHPPLGYEVYRWLFENIPQMGILRNPYEKFGLVWLLCYGLLLSVGVDSLFKKGKSLFLISLPVLFILVWPMWTGDVYMDNIRVTVPKYLKEANEIIYADRDQGRIVVLPMLDGDGAKYNWGYQGLEPSEFIFSRPVISRIFRTDYPDKKYYQLYQSILETGDIQRNLADMNVKYLLVNYDLHEDYRGKMSMEVVRSAVNKLDGEIIFDEGNVVVYKLNTPSELFETDKEVNMTYDKISADHYRINIEDVTEPFNLIFKTTYNPLWTAKINQEEVENHGVVYDYANQWFISMTGSYTIDIYFKVWPWQ